MKVNSSKQELLTYVHKINERYKDIDIPEDLRDLTNTFENWVRVFRIIEFPEKYEPDNQNIIFGFHGDYGIIHKIPGVGQEWIDLVFLENMIFTFCRTPENIDILYPQPEDIETKIINSLKRLGSKQYIKGLATSLRGRDRKLSQKRLLNQLVHCDDKDEEIPLKFRGRTNQFSGDWTEEQYDLARDILIDIFLENPHHIPLLSELSRESERSIDDKLRKLQTDIISKLLISQTTELGNIKSILCSIYNWNETFNELEELKKIRPHKNFIPTLIVERNLYMFIQSKIDSGEWKFKKPGAVKRELEAAKKKIVNQVTAARHNGNESLTHLKRLKESEIRP